MKRPFSPLVWLCAAGTVALGALTVYDPNGVYAEYVAALDRDTPVIAAVFSAAQDGVYPWTAFSQPQNGAVSPAYRPLNESVTDEEMRSSVGNEEPFRESSAETLPAESGVPTVVTPSVEVVTAQEIKPAEAPEADDNKGSASAADFVPVGMEWFDDALFIGDSHTEGFCDYAGVRNATYYYKRGVDIWSVMNKAFVGGKQTIPQALSTRQFGKIYIMLGINEIGCGTTESFAAQYAKVVGQLRELQPNALIYIQAIFHTSQKKSVSSLYNNDTINARNEAISRIADGEHIFFVNCNEVFDDESGALTPAYSGDGVHVKAPYYTMWRDYLLRFGRAGVAAVSTVSEESAATESPAPVTESPAPSVPAPAPETSVAPENTPAPAEAPAPTSAPAAAETPVPEAAAPAPVAQTPAPEAGTPADASDAPAPEAETPTPEPEPSAPEANVPVAEPIDPVPAPTESSEEPAVESAV